MIDEKDIVGFGKFQTFFEGRGKKYFLPNFHYIIIRDKGPKNDDGFTSICLELGTTYWSKNKDDGNVENLIKISMAFLESIDNEEGTFENLIKLLQDNSNEKLWSIYRTLSIKHTIEGKKHAETAINEIILRLLTENEKLKNDLLSLQFESQQQTKSATPKSHYFSYPIEKNLTSVGKN